MNQRITEVGAAFRLPTTLATTMDDIPQEVGSPYNSGLRKSADTSKADTRTEHTDTALDIQGAENLLSISQGSATSVDGVDEQPEDSGIRGPRTRSRSEN